MGLMDIFATKPAAPATPVQTTGAPPAGGSGSVQIDTSLARAADPNNPGNKTGGEGASPLEEFSTLWDNTPAQGTEGDGKNLTQQTQTPTKPDFGKIAKNIDFSKAVNSELATKALSGDMSAFTTVIGQVAQAAVAASMSAAHQLSLKSAKDMQTTIMGSLSGEFKKFSLGDTTNENPTFNHPSVRPIVDSIMEQMRTKFPEATTDELRSKSQKYFNAMISEAQKSQPGRNANDKGGPEFDSRGKTVQSQATGDFDWENYLNGEQPT